MKLWKFFMVAVTASLLGGCFTLTEARDWLADPKTAQAAQTLKSWGVAVSCSVSQGAYVAEQLSYAVDAGQAVIDRAGKVYTVSATVCKLLGGTSGAKVNTSNIIVTTQ